MTVLVNINGPSPTTYVRKNIIKRRKTSQRQRHQRRYRGPLLRGILKEQEYSGVKIIGPSTSEWVKKKGEQRKRSKTCSGELYYFTLCKKKIYVFVYNIYTEKYVLLCRRIRIFILLNFVSFSPRNVMTIVSKCRGKTPFFLFSEFTGNITVAAYDGFVIVSVFVLVAMLIQISYRINCKRLHGNI